MTDNKKTHPEGCCCPLCDVPPRGLSKLIGFDTFTPITVWLTNGRELHLNKGEWDFTTYGIRYGDNRRTALIPWNQIEKAYQEHRD